MDQGTHEVPPPIAWGSDALRDVATERLRQIESEGWTPEHDDEHKAGGLRSRSLRSLIRRAYGKVVFHHIAVGVGRLVQQLVQAEEPAHRPGAGRRADRRRD